MAELQIVEELNNTLTSFAAGLSSDRFQDMIFASIFIVLGFCLSWCGRDFNGCTRFCFTDLCIEFDQWIILDW